MINLTKQAHVFATVHAIDVEAGFLRSGDEMQCYVVTVGSVSKPVDTLVQAQAFVRWHETQEGEPGEHEQYSIVRVSWSADALALERGGFVEKTGHQAVELTESGVVYYAAEAAQQGSVNMKYAYVVVGQEVFGLGDTAEAALADAAQYLEGGADEAQSCLDSGSAVIVPVSEARAHCRAGESSILPQFGL